MPSLLCTVWWEKVVGGGFLRRVAARCSLSFVPPSREVNYQAVRHSCWCYLSSGTTRTTSRCCWEKFVGPAGTAVGSSQQEKSWGHGRPMRKETEQKKLEFWLPGQWTSVTLTNSSSNWEVFAPRCEKWRILVSSAQSPFWNPKWNDFICGSQHSFFVQQL